jgi:hypothetical protein
LNKPLSINDIRAADEFCGFCKKIFLRDPEPSKPASAAEGGNGLEECHVEQVRSARSVPEKLFPQRLVIF